MGPPRVDEEPDYEPVNFHAGNITDYVMAYHNIQERKDEYEVPYVKMPSPFRKSNKWLHFANIECK